MALREYNALNGIEVKNGIGIDLKSELVERLGNYREAGEVRYAFEGRVESYPADQPIALNISGVAQGTGLEIVEQIGKAVRRHLDLDTRLNQHLTFHRVRWPFQTILEVLRPAGSVVEPEIVREPVVTGNRIDFTTLEPKPVTERMFTEAHARPAERSLILVTDLSPEEQEIKALEAKLEQLRSGKTETTTVDPHQRIVARTGTGLPISAGALPAPSSEAAASWGNGSAVGSVPGRVVVERTVVAHNPPPLDAGGEGAPDVVRRATNQPIPGGPGRRDPLAGSF